MPQDYPIGYKRKGRDGVWEVYQGKGVWAEVNPELPVRRASLKINKKKA